MPDPYSGRRGRCLYVDALANIGISRWHLGDPAGQPTLEELAKAIREFRATGKKVIAYGDELTQERYYIAAQADEIYLDPMGFVLIDGYARYRMFYKEALDKLGVDINVFRVGAFKSAVESYTRTDMSPEDKQESNAYLNALWSSYQDAITRSRKLPADATPLLEQRDTGTFVVMQRQRRSQTGDKIVAQLALDALLLQHTYNRAEIGIRRDLE